MKKNRLQLDFSIGSAKDRRDFLDTYLQKEEFKQKPLTETELETCAKYLLYGKDKDGTTAISRKEIQIDTKNKTWNADRKILSLDSLLDKEENPGFNEDVILKPYQRHYKVVREVFSREEALRRAPDGLKETFQDLFNQIDQTELLINYYDLFNGKRTKPPRDELLARVPSDIAATIKKNAETIPEYTYLKKKHLLVELRRQQYTLRDSYEITVHPEGMSRGAPIEPNEQITFDFDVPVYPLGIYQIENSQKIIFKPFSSLNPTNFTEQELKYVSSIYWEKQNPRPEVCFDFTDLEHVYQLILSREELEDKEEGLDSTNVALFRTLDYYTEMAELTEVQHEILKMKVHHMKNQDIAAEVNKRFGKSYTTNYISTIFRQRIIKQINGAAAFHEKIVSNLFFKEEFKKCNCCGEIYLICPDNFVRKSRSKDGYTNRCKKCDREKRSKKEE